MSESLVVTFRYLARTANEAASEILLAALDETSPHIRQLAVAAILDRRDAQGHREVFQRLPHMDEASRQATLLRADRLASVAVAALKCGKSEEFRTLCATIVDVRLYDTLGALSAALEQADDVARPVLAQTILRLGESLYEELSGGDGPPQRKNIDTLRLKMTAQLEDAARKYHRHQCQEVLEALLLIARPSNATLRQLIARPDEAACQPILDLLAKSGRGGVIRLLLGFLEEPQAPLAVLRILGARTDARFVEHLLRTLATRPQRNANENLARIDTVAWAEPAHPLLAELSEGAQAGAVEMLLVTSVERSRVRDVLKHLLEQGNVGGRRAAAKAIVQFHGPEVDALLVRMLGDPDAEVRAAVIPHLRPRRIELALGRLIRMADSNEPAVRQALREALPEFSLQRFLGSFMHFDEEMQMMAGSLIRRIDDQVAEKLTAEMTGLSPVRRRRAVLAAAVMGMTHELEQVIIQLLSDDDHMVRVAAAQALAECKSVPSWEALRDALLDRSVVVKEAAEKSLEQISASLTSDAADELDDLPGTPAERTEYTPC